MLQPSPVSTSRARSSRDLGDGPGIVFHRKNAFSTVPWR